MGSCIAFLRQKVGQTKNEIDTSNAHSPIEWHVYNYPPLLRLYHYQEHGIKQHTIDVIRKMKLAANIIMLIYLVNLINNIVQMSATCELIKTKQIIYSVLSK